MVGVGCPRRLVVRRRLVAPHGPTGAFAPCEQFKVGTRRTRLDDRDYLIRFPAVLTFDGPDEIDSQPRQQPADTQSVIDAFVDNVGDGDIDDEFLPY